MKRRNAQINLWIFCVSFIAMWLGVALSEGDYGPAVFVFLILLMSVVCLHEIIHDKSKQ